MKKVKRVSVLGEYRLELEFDDGVCGIVDLSHLVGRGVFSDWKDRENFDKVKIAPSGELVWDGGQDLCPDSLYLSVTGQSPEDLFPTLGQRVQCA